MYIEEASSVVQLWAPLGIGDFYEQPMFACVSLKISIMVYSGVSNARAGIYCRGVA